VRLVGEAVSEFRSEGAPGTGVEQLQEVRIEIPVDAHLPHDYIGSERLRLEMYKRLSEVRSDEDVALLREEMLDRYGEPPAQVDRLLEVARFRGRVRQAGLTEVTAQGKYVRFAPVDLPDSAVVRLQRLHPKSVVKTTVRTMLVPRPSSVTLRDEELLAWARKVIDTVIDPAGAATEENKK
jgi:transcription-repair coupling factor (superfamily II helicase)